MKVFDIISEAPIGKDELKARRERAAAANQRLKDIEAERQRGEKAKADSSARRSNYQSWKDQNKTKSALRTTRKTLSNPKAAGPVKDIAAYVKANQSRWRSNQNAAKATETKWMKAMGTPLVTLMKVFGIVQPITQLYVDLDAADQDYQQGLLDANELERTREFLFGAFSTQILVPLVARITTKAILATQIARVIKWLAAGVGGAVTGGASVVAAIATEGFFIWLQNWLGSDEGKNFLANDLLLPIVKGMGKVPEGVWSKLTSYYDKTKDAAGQTPNQQKAGAPAPGQPAPAGQQPTPGAQPAAVPQQPGTVSADDFIKSLK